MMNLLPRILLFAAPIVLLALSAVPGALIKRAKARTAVDAVADFRDTLAPAADPEQAALDAKWNEYWAESDAQWLRSDLRARLLSNDEAVSEIVDAFEADCEAIVKRFITDALRTCRRHANAYGRWADDTAREADRWYTMAVTNHTTVGHLVEQEITDTRWTAHDTRALNAYLEEQAGLEAHA